MSVKCTRCAKEFLRDPALEVACPVCDMHIGKPCKGMSGIHLGREYKAIARGFSERCSDGKLHDIKVLEVGPLFSKSGDDTMKDDDAVLSADNFAEHLFELATTSAHIFERGVAAGIQLKTRGPEMNQNRIHLAAAAVDKVQDLDSCPGCVDDDQPHSLACRAMVLSAISNGPRYPICPECLNALDTPDKLKVCPCGLVFGKEADSMGPD